MEPIIVIHDDSATATRALSLALERADLSHREVHVNPGAMSGKTAMVASLLAANPGIMIADRPPPPVEVHTLTIPEEYEVPFVGWPSKHRGKRRGVRAGGAFGKCRNRP